jgi:hypothetical protein
MRRSIERIARGFTALALRLLFAATAFAATAFNPAAFAAKTQNVVLIVSDGLRWQEIFTVRPSEELPFSHSSGNEVDRAAGGAEPLSAAIFYIILVTITKAAALARYESCGT